VDDDPQVRETNMRALTYEGYSVIGAGNGLQALTLLQDEAGEDIRLVITDVRMPGMTGDDLGRVLHRLRPDLPVLYISGYSAPDLDFLTPAELERCWLAKPFTPPRLIARVRELLVRSVRSPSHPSSPTAPAPAR
jgi:DNA-binding response OmpR family regulator